MTKDGQDTHDEQESARDDEHDPEPEAAYDERQVRQVPEQVAEESVDREQTPPEQNSVEQKKYSVFQEEITRLCANQIFEEKTDGDEQIEIKERPVEKSEVDYTIGTVPEKIKEQQEASEIGKGIGKDDVEDEGESKEERPEESEGKDTVSQLAQPLDDVDDANANIEMPAITKEPVQALDETEESADESVATESAKTADDTEHDPIVHPGMQEAAQTPPDSIAKEESLAEQEPEKKLDAGPIDSAQPVAEENKQNGRKGMEDPYEVQKVLDELLPWQEESRPLRATYASTTAYRVAIKKKRSTTVGNTIFLICSALALLVVVIAFIPYFAQSLAGSKTNVPAGTVQATPSPNRSGVPANLTGAETSAPRANGSILAGYQWIHEGTKHDLYIDANNHIQELASGDGLTWQITDLTRRSGAALANGRTLVGFEWQHGNSAQVVYIDAKQHVQQLYGNGDGQWDVLDLTRKAQAPLANGTVIIGYEWTSNGSKQVDYIDQRGHIQELASNDGVNWTVSDLTTLTKAPQANGNVLTGYQWNRLGSKHVDYIDINQHVQELSFTGGIWHRSDLNTLVGAPPANGRALTSYQWRQSGSRLIAYLDTSNHVQLLASINANNWTLIDLTHLLNAPVANGNTLLGYEWQQGGQAVLYFLDENDHLQEMSDAPGENWQLADLNQFTQGAPPANGKVLIGYDWAQHGSKQIVYIDNTNTVRELTSSNIPGRWELYNWKRS